MKNGETTTSGVSAKRQKSEPRQIIKLLAERLAIAVAYIQSLDDSIDPFADPDVDLSWLIATLTASAKRDIFRGSRRHEPWDMDCSSVIKAARQGKSLSIIDTDIYQECLTAIRKMVREYET